VKRAIAAGINAVEALLDTAPERVVRIWLAQRNPRLDALADQAETHGVPIERCRPQALDRISDGARHQGIAAEFQPTAPLGEADLDAVVERRGADTLLLLLDQVQDPHNLGACLRSAAAAGADAVVIPRDRAAALTPATRRAAAGAAERVALVEVANLARAIERLQRAGVWCIGLAGEAADSLYSMQLDGALALVLGGEDKGLRRLTRERCDALAVIPMPGGFESLNVSVAAGIALFEALRQRHQDIGKA